jgi:hypothetical protein
MNSNLHVADREHMRHCIAKALDAAASDWKAGVSEADRRAGNRIDEMFRRSGWSSRGVPKGETDEVRDWCGMAAALWMIDGGINPGFNTSFLHCYNLMDFFRYGKPRAYNRSRLDHWVDVDGVELAIEEWHRLEEMPRNWMGRAGIVDGLLPAKTPNKTLFEPGDIMLIDWGNNGIPDHITVVAQWDAETRTLHTWEGNRTGRDVNGKPVKDAVVPCTYDLSKPATARMIFGRGRFSPLDFTDYPVRPK